jgi:hypothetical protein
MDYFYVKKKHFLLSMPIEKGMLMDETDNVQCSREKIELHRVALSFHIPHQKETDVL